MENEKHRSGWIVAAICGGLVLLMLVGTVIALRDQMEASARAQAKEQTKEREKLSAGLAAVEAVNKAARESTRRPFVCRARGHR